MAMRQILTRISIAFAGTAGLLLASAAHGHFG